MTADQPGTVGIVGFGEVGRGLAAHVRSLGLDVLVTNRSPDRLRTELADRAVGVASDPASLAAESDLVFSCVWPESAATVATAAAAGVEAGTVYVDLNSVSPGTARAMEATIADAGGRFVQGSLVGSVSKLGVRTPIVLAGAHHEEAVDLLAAIDLDAESFGTDPGRPAVLRMSRSLVTKGIMVLFLEALLLAHEYDLTEELFESVEATFENFTLTEFARFYLVDMVGNAGRRAGELQEVLDAAADAGVRAPIAEQTFRVNETMAAADIEAETYEDVLGALRPYFAEE